MSEIKVKVIKTKKMKRGIPLLIYLFLILSLCLFVYPIVDTVEGKSITKELYTIQVGDQIRIKVLEHPELDTITQVTADGTISFPYLGTVFVKGMTLAGIEEEVAEGLSAGYVKYPVVSVSLLKFTGDKFFVYGEVMRPGEFPFEGNITLTKAMSIAGGVSPDGLYGNVKIRRQQKGGGYKDIEVDLKGIIKGVVEDDFLLQPDDILIVERNKTFLIQGEVARLGQFVLEEGMTVLRALLQAGGVTNDGLYGKLKVRRKQEGAPGGYKDLVEAELNEGVMNSKEVEDTLLQPDDILMVERNKTFLIQGEVVQRGRFVLEEGMTVLRALLQAGGVTNDGLYGRLKVRRKQEGAPGGYKDLVEAELNEGVMNSKEVEDTLLQPDDILMVERNKTFFIYGEVNKTGEFMLQNDMTVFKAITVAGGFTKWGSPKHVKLLRLKEDRAGYMTTKVNINAVIEGDASADIILQPGDIIIVSRGFF